VSVFWTIGIDVMNGGLECDVRIRRTGKAGYILFAEPLKVGFELKDGETERTM
jgi:hypothetical protein